MPRLVRRKPLLERIKSAMDPMDFLLWLSEEIETRDWDSQTIGTQIGIGMNFAFLVARANSGSTKSAADSVFDEPSISGWVAFLVGTVVWSLMAFSICNAFYTMTRARYYRLFEADVETKPATPSARRVRVKDDMPTASPLRFIADMVAPDNAESRAHPDKAHDVWQLSVWDPLAISLRIFSLFSPAHILVYWVFLPLEALAKQPSVTVFNCLLLQAVISAQLWLVQSRYAGQIRDTAVVQKEVMHEYDAKFVHPRLFPSVRDAGTQLVTDASGTGESYVELGKPHVQLKRGFHTRPNPYIENVNEAPARSKPPYRDNSSINISGPMTPLVPSRHSDIGVSSALHGRPSTVRRSTPGSIMPSSAASVNPRMVDSAVSATPSVSHGGYLGVMNHPSSPLKKAASIGDLNYRSPRNNAEMARYEQQQAWEDRQPSTSPHKSARKSTSALPGPDSVPSPKQPWTQRPRNSYERYPSMWNR
ncbi:hypothetical protein Micbo1qcDRAFT_233497 [Microdochium bolleyi]|uniref:Meiotically up-regulated gene 154 protein n=1 Tax=Microdochium bolleyi TaxID=196109 RepID=A0A136J4Q9_9PEZI|nr:hypothetical protein Micbo1qcDRAFT_233497 [Microdochium bolleyi]